MANPNIVNVSDIRGKTAIGILNTSNADLVTNAASSGKVFKINTIIVSNIDGTVAADANIRVVSADGLSMRHLASTIAVPADSTLVVLSKDTAIYLEEGMKINGSASAAGDLEYVISYEEIS